MCKKKGGGGIYPENNNNQDGEGFGNLVGTFSIYVKCTNFRVFFLNVDF